MLDGWAGCKCWLLPAFNGIVEVIGLADNYSAGWLMDLEDQTLNRHGVESKKISGSIDQADHQKIKTILLIDLPFKYFFFGTNLIG